MIDAAAGGNDAGRRVVRRGSGYGDVVRVMIGVILIDELDPLIGFHVIQRSSRRRAGLRLESITQLLQRLASLGRVRAGSELSVDSVGSGVGGPVTGIESTRVTPHQLFNFCAVLFPGGDALGENCYRAERQRANDCDHKADSNRVHVLLLERLTRLKHSRAMYVNNRLQAGKTGTVSHFKRVSEIAHCPHFPVSEVDMPAYSGWLTHQADCRRIAE